MCLYNAGRVPESTVTNRISYSGLRARRLRSNLGLAIWVALLLLPYCKQAVGGDGQLSFPLFLRPLTSLSSLVIAGIYGNPGWTSESFLQSLFASWTLLRRAPSFGLPHPSHEWPKVWHYHSTLLNWMEKESQRLVCSSYSPTLIVHKTLLPNIYFPLQPGIAFPRLHSYFYGLPHKVLVRNPIKYLQNSAQD